MATNYTDYPDAVLQAQSQLDRGESLRKSFPAGTLGPAKVQQDSLASVAPRVISMACEVQQQVSHIWQSLGLAVPEQGESNATAGQPTLMSQLQVIEARLRDTASMLSSINEHINGEG